MISNTPNLISIIVPVYNGERTIASCLSSIYNSKIDVKFEVIVVDDASTDGTKKVVQQFSCRYFTIEKLGAAAARNLGIKQAKGEIIFFFDADIKLKNGTIKQFLQHFSEDKDAFIIQGRWDESSAVKTFSSRFFLHKYTYNFQGMFNGKRRIEVANLETGCLAIRAEVFNLFNGFNEEYRFSGGEEHEFGIRLLSRYKIFYYPDIFVEHPFGSILKNLGKIYRRTVNFSLLSFQVKDKKHFLSLHRNSVPFNDKVSVLMILLMLCSTPILFFNLKLGLMLLAILFISYITVNFRFLAYLVRKENVFFALSGAFANFLIMLPRFFGLFTALYMFYLFRKRDFKI